MPSKKDENNKDKSRNSTAEWDDTHAVLAICQQDANKNDIAQVTEKQVSAVYFLACKSGRDPFEMFRDVFGFIPEVVVRSTNCPPYRPFLGRVVVSSEDLLKKRGTPKLERQFARFKMA